MSWLRKYVQRLESNSLGKDERLRVMRSLNPKYVLRNYLAQMAIDKAEAGDASMINELLMFFVVRTTTNPSSNTSPRVVPTGRAAALAVRCCPAVHSGCGSARRGEQMHAYKPPNRRFLLEKSATASRNLSPSKSGQ